MFAITSMQLLLIKDITTEININTITLRNLILINKIKTAIL